MLHNIRIIIFFCGLFLIGCTSMPIDLKLAEQALKEKPDSALVFLHRIPLKTLSKDNRAFYGILLFQALDKTNQTLQPDSVINFSVNYYQESSKERELAISYYYKARLYKKAQQFDKATGLYLKALDIFQNSDNFYFLGKIYSDMADVCAFQKDYKESLFKYELSSKYFQKASDSIEACNKLIDIGRVYKFLNNPQKAHWYYNKAISQTTDSTVIGAAFQEIGINYFYLKNYDSAKYVLRQSLLYPFRGTSYSIRCYIIADAYFETNQLDSAMYFSQLAFNYPSTFFIQRECYRILANTEYRRGNFDSMGTYFKKYQECTDSVRQIEIQTKSTILEEIHETKGAVVKSKYFSFILAVIILVITLLGYYIFTQLRKRNKNKEEQLETAETKLIQKQVLLKDNLIKKIEENKLSKAAAYKKSTLSERELIDKEIYTFCLHLDDWNSFEKLMNQTFNNLFIVLKEKSSEINHKELILCSLLLLDVPTNEMILILECQQGSFYKLKQRLAQKLKLTSTKDLEQLLQNLSSEN